MQKIALSIQNPYSYFVCSGMKPVENRTWKTDYRGRIYIHSSGQREYMAIDDSWLPEKFKALMKEFDVHCKDCKTTDDAKAVLKKLGSVNRFDDIFAFVTASDKISDLMQMFYHCNVFKCSDERFDTLKRNGLYFYRSMSIIGHVDLEDIIQDSISSWAENNCYHWIFQNPVLYEKPVINVKGKLRLFDVSHITLPD